MTDERKTQDKPNSLWRHPDFMKLWTGQTISELGSRITRDGLPLTAVLILGANPVEMGLLSAIGAAPVLFFALIAGVWVDRVRRRPVMILADILRALVLLAIPAAAVVGRLNMPLLYIVVIVTSILTVLFDIAYQAYFPSLVERENVLEGNTRLQLSNSSAEVIGPGLAGLLVQLLTAPIAIFLDAVSFIFSALAVALIRKPEAAPRRSTENTHFLLEMRQGLQVAFRQPILRALIGAAGTMELFGNFIGPLYALYAIRDLGLGPAAIGLTITAGGIGDLIGAFFAPRVVRKFGLGATMLGSLVIGKLMILLLPLAGGNLYTSFLLLTAAQVFGDGARMIYFINDLSLRQAITPNHLLGRANASLQLVLAGIGPLGALAGGVLGQAIGIRATLVVASLGSLLAFFWVFFSPVRSLTAQPASAASPDFDLTAENG